MGDTFKVDVEALKRAGSTVADHATALSGSHRQSMIGLSDSESGWVGSSADALVGMADKWQQIADKHTAAIDNQAAQMGTAARLAAAMEQRNAENLKNIGDQADDVSVDL